MKDCGCKRWVDFNQTCLKEAEERLTVVRYLYRVKGNRKVDPESRCLSREWEKNTGRPRLGLEDSTQMYLEGLREEPKENMRGEGWCKPVIHTSFTPDTGVNGGGGGGHVNYNKYSRASRTSPTNLLAV